MQTRRDIQNDIQKELAAKLRLTAIISRTWKAMVENGAPPDPEDPAEISYAIEDAATNTYTDDATDEEWLRAILKQLNRSDVDLLLQRARDNYASCAPVRE
jgi:hypothetical protein